MDSPDHVDAPITFADSLAAIERLLRQRLRRHAADEDELDDIVQETWLTALVNRRGLREERSAAGWVLRTGHRVALTRSVESARCGAGTMHSLRSRNGPRSRTRRCVPTAPRSTARSASTSRWTPSWRSPSASDRWPSCAGSGGFSTADAAEQLAIAPGTVKAALHHARARMRAMLAPGESVAWCEVA